MRLPSEREREREMNKMMEEEEGGEEGTLLRGGGELAWEEIGSTSHLVVVCRVRYTGIISVALLHIPYFGCFPPAPFSCPEWGKKKGRYIQQASSQGVECARTLE